MNGFYDYLIVRIYRWYESFENEPSKYTAKLLIAFHQTFLVVIITHLFPYYETISTFYLKVIFVTLMVILYIRLYLRYSNEEFFKSLLLKWSQEEKRIKLIRGLAIPIIIFLPIIIALFL